MMADLLVVDDDVDAADMLADVLKGEGHVVRIAHDGKQGLSALAVRLPDVVLLDVEMPVLMGPEMVLQMFLNDCGEEEVPVILVSGVWNLAAVAAQVGTPYFLAKPYAVPTLLTVIGRVLAERSGPPRKCR